MDEYSMRELVVLYCNTDIVVQWSGDYEYFVYFLLPYNAFVLVGNVEREKWQFDEMRVLYYTVEENVASIKSIIEEAKNQVIEKKYKGL